MTILPDLDMISGAFVFQSLTLHPTANPVDPSRKTDPFTITPVVRPPKNALNRFLAQKTLKDKETPGQPRKIRQNHFQGVA